MSPISPDTFPFKTKPYEHQLDIFRKSAEREYYGLWMEQGTGKTKVIIDTACYAFMTARISAVVIFANKGVYGNWYYEELPKHSTIPYRAYLYRGYYRSGEIQEFNKILGRGDLAWLIINVDALDSAKFGALLKRFVKDHPSYMVVGDETTSIKNHKSNRTKAAMKLAEKATMRRAMSGLPNPQSPLDLFSQCQFLKPGITGHSSYYSFKNHYAIQVPVRYGNRSFIKIDGFRDLEQLNRKLRDFSVIIKLDDCTDLPEKTYKTMYVDLTDEQRKAYDDLKSRAVAYIQDHEITAVNALALLTRLLQICCGQLKVGENDYVSIENERIKATQDLVEETPHKVIVWTSYRRTAQDLASAFKDRAILLPGGLNADERQERLVKYRTGQPQVLIANPASSGHGLTLNEAKLAIYYSNSFNLEHRLQSEARNHRIGQTEKVTYIDLVAPNTIEGKVLEALKAKKKLADQVIHNQALKEFLE